MDEVEWTMAFLQSKFAAVVGWFVTYGVSICHFHKCVIMLCGMSKISSCYQSRLFHNFNGPKYSPRSSLEVYYILFGKNNK